MSPSKRSRRPKRRSNRQPVHRPIDPIITARRMPITAVHIPQHISNPSVQRVVRLAITLTSGTPTFTVNYSQLAIQDFLDYIVLAPRYTAMRVFRVSVWAESPNSLSVSQLPYGILVQDPLSGFSIRDRPTTGSRLNAVSMSLPFVVRTTIASVSSVVSILIITSDPTPAAATDFSVTADFSVEFY